MRTARICSQNTRCPRGCAAGNKAFFMRKFRQFLWNFTAQLCTLSLNNTDVLLAVFLFGTCRDVRNF